MWLNQRFPPNVCPSLSAPASSSGTRRFGIHPNLKLSELCSNVAKCENVVDNHHSQAMAVKAMNLNKSQLAYLLRISNSPTPGVFLELFDYHKYWD